MARSPTVVPQVTTGTPEIASGSPRVSTGSRPDGSVSPSAGGRRYSTVVTSSNWSGYAATSSTTQFTSVSSSWTQPAGNCRSGNQYAAFWVGLDGYSSGTVEQTGSEVDCIGRTPHYYGWYEMYPGASSDYSNTVKAGASLATYNPVEITMPDVSVSSLSSTGNFSVSYTGSGSRLPYPFGGF